MSSITERLHSLQIFSELSPEELEILASITTSEKFEKGHIFFDEGDEGQSLYFIQSGEVRITTLVQDSLRKPIVTLHDGSVFGEVSLIDKNPREARAEATEDTEVLCIEGDKFTKMVDEHPALGVKFHRVLIKRIVERLRYTTYQYRQNIQWGLQISGAMKINLHHLITDEVDVSLELSNGKSVTGTLLKVEESDAGHEIILRNAAENRVQIIPYQAVVSVSFQREDLRIKQEEAIPEGLE